MCSLWKSGASKFTHPSPRRLRLHGKQGESSSGVGEIHQTVSIHSRSRHCFYGVEASNADILASDVAVLLLLPLCQKEL